MKNTLSTWWYKRQNNNFSCSTHSHLFRHTFSTHFLQVSVLAAYFKINFGKGLVMWGGELVSKSMEKTIREKLPCYKMAEICLSFFLIKVTIRNDFILMLLDWVFLSCSILKKAEVSFLLLKLKAIKTHPRICTKKHILSCWLVCSSFKKGNFDFKFYY